MPSWGKPSSWIEGGGDHPEFVFDSCTSYLKQPGQSWPDPQDRCTECECHNNKIECVTSDSCKANDQKFTDPTPPTTLSPPPYPTPPKPVKPVKETTPYPPTKCLVSHYTPWMNTSAPNSFGKENHCQSYRHCSPYSHIYIDIWDYMYWTSLNIIGL